MGLYTLKLVLQFSTFRTLPPSLCYLFNVSAKHLHKTSYFRTGAPIELRLRIICGEFVM